MNTGNESDIQLHTEAAWVCFLGERLGGFNIFKGFSSRGYMSWREKTHNYSTVALLHSIPPLLPHPPLATLPPYTARVTLVTFTLCGLQEAGLVVVVMGLFYIDFVWFVIKPSGL